MSSTNATKGGAAALIVAAAIAMLAPNTASGTPAEGHLVSAAVEIDDGAWFGLDAQASYAGAVGKALLAHATPGGSHVVEITIDCLEVSWHQPTYPVPPYLPYHLAEASGTTWDGTRYHIAAFDMVAEPVGFGDRLTLTTEPGDGACGASMEAGPPVASGEITIVL